MISIQDFRFALPSNKWSILPSPRPGEFRLGFAVNDSKPCAVAIIRRSPFGSNNVDPESPEAMFDPKNGSSTEVSILHNITLQVRITDGFFGPPRGSVYRQLEYGDSPILTPPCENYQLLQVPAFNQAGRYYTMEMIGPRHVISTGKPEFFLLMRNVVSSASLPIIKTPDFPQSQSPGSWNKETAKQPGITLYNSHTYGDAEPAGKLAFAEQQSKTNKTQDSGQSYTLSLLGAPFDGMDKTARLIGSSFQRWYGLVVDDTWHITQAELLRKSGTGSSFVNPIHAGRLPIQALRLLPLFAVWIGVVALLHHMRRLFVFSEQTRRAETDIKSVTTAPVLIGVKGWLLFFAVSSTILGPLVIMGRALSFGRIVHEARSFTALPDAVELSRLLWLHIAVSAGFAVMCSVVGTKLWKARPDALIWLRRCWWASCFWLGFFVLAFHQTNPFPERWLIDGSSLAACIIALVISRSYFGRSRRVAGTFGPWLTAAHRKTTFCQESKAVLRGWLATDGRQTSSSAAPPETSGQRMMAHLLWQTPSPTDVNAPPSQMLDDSSAVDEMSESRQFNTAKAVMNTHVEKPHDSSQTANLLAAYSQIAKEQAIGYHHEGLWLMCITECEGDDERATLLYNRRRAEMLAREQLPSSGPEA